MGVINFVLKYDKTQYTAKIAELEGYLAILDGHLGNLETLKNQIDSFWESDNATANYNNLAETIRTVKIQQSTARETLAFYKGVVEKYAGTSTAIDEETKMALEAVKSAAAFIK